MGWLKVMPNWWYILHGIRDPSLHLSMGWLKVMRKCIARKWRSNNAANPFVAGCKVDGAPIRPRRRRLQDAGPARQAHKGKLTHCWVKNNNSNCVHNALVSFVFQAMHVFVDNFDAVPDDFEGDGGGDGIAGQRHPNEFDPA